MSDKPKFSAFIAEMESENERLTAENESLTARISELEEGHKILLDQKQVAEETAAAAQEATRLAEQKLEEGGLTSASKLREGVVTAEKLTLEALDEVKGAEARIIHAKKRYQQVIDGAKARGEENRKLREILTSDRFARVETLASTMAELGAELMRDMVKFTKAYHLVAGTDDAKLASIAKEADKRFAIVEQIDEWSAQTSSLLSEKVASALDVIDKELKKASNGHVAALTERRDSIEAWRANVEIILHDLTTQRDGILAEANALNCYHEAYRIAKDGPPSTTFDPQTFTPPSIPEIDLEVVPTPEPDVAAAAPAEQPEPVTEGKEDVVITINGPQRVADAVEGLSPYVVLLVALYEVKPPASNNNNYASPGRLMSDAVEVGFLTGSLDTLHEQSKAWAEEAAAQGMLHKHPKTPGLYLYSSETTPLRWQSKDALHHKQRDKFRRQYEQTTANKRTQRNNRNGVSTTP